MDRVVRVVLTGDSAGAVAAMGETAAAADEAGTSLEGAGSKAEEGGGKIKSFLSDIGVPSALLNGWAELGIAAAGTAVEAVRMGAAMQTSDAAIATSSGISMKAATDIGNAFLDTAGTSEFSGKEMADAFASVAGQLKSVEGHALTTKEAMTVMSAAGDLATAKQISLSDATSTLAATMQAFQQPTKDAANASNILFNASNATGQSVDSVGAALDKTRTKLGAMSPPLSDLAGLLVDMTDHGETGRAAMSALSTTFTALLKPEQNIVKAQQDLKTATDDLPPSLDALAKEYQSGTLTSAQLSAATKDMTTSQTTAWSTMVSATTAVQKADQAQQALGLTVTNSAGQFVGVGSIIDQFHDKIQGMSDAQATATLSADGLGSSAAKLLPIIQAGGSAFDKAADSVSKTGSAANAAQTQSETLGVEWKTLKATTEDWLTILGEKLIPVLTDVSTWLGTHLPDAINFLKGVFNDLKPTVDGMEAEIGGFIKVVQGIVTFLDGVFSGNWSNAWAGLKKIFDGFVQGLEGDVKSWTGGLLADFYNLGPDMYRAGSALMGELIQGVVSGLSGIGSAIESSIKSATSHIPVVGKALSAIGLATGGIVTQPTLAVVGESGPEAVIPLTNIAAVGTSNVGPLSGLAGAAGGGVLGGGSSAGGAVGMDVYLQINGQTFAKATVNDIRQALLVKGRGVVNIGLS